MPITVSRQSGAVSVPEYAPDQIDRAWEAIVRNWRDNHPDDLEKLRKECASEPRGE